MSMFARAFRFGLAVFAVALVGAAPASAAITTLNYWHLGESDPGATNGGAITSAVDSVGAANLTPTGSPTYTSSVDPLAAYTTDTTLAAAFNGSTDYLRYAAPVSSLTSNFGIELWARTNNTSANSSIAYNGSTSSNGWGIYRIGSQYRALYGGKAAFGAGAATIGEWTHLALVSDGGTSTFYVNGVAAGTSAASPNVATTAFALGIAPQAFNEFFNGAIDEVRIFSFAPGQFQVNDLLIFQTPEPASSLLIALGGLGMLAIRRRAKARASQLQG